VLLSHNALWFSPDGGRIAYLKFNESLVPVKFIYLIPQVYKLQMYETPHSSYPKEVSIKYPKPGFPNPTVSLHITTTSMDIESDSIVLFNGTDAFTDEDRLIVEVKWMTKNDTLLVRLMNRYISFRLFLKSPRSSTYFSRYSGSFY
jgi:dipeptidyl aminopeptidase